MECFPQVKFIKERFPGCNDDSIEMLDLDSDLSFVRRTGLGLKLEFRDQVPRVLLPPQVRRALCMIAEQNSDRE